MNFQVIISAGQPKARRSGSEFPGWPAAPKKEGIVRALVEEVVLARDGLLIRLRLHGLNALVAELQGESPAEVGKDGQLVLRSEAPLRRVATVDVRAAMEFKVRGGRKEIILPKGANVEPKAQPNRPLVLALARAHRWQRTIESGEVPGVEAIAAQHRMERTYVSRILGLATLAPEIVEAALKGNEPSGLSMRKLLNGRLRVRWDQQRPALLAQ